LRRPLKDILKRHVPAEVRDTARRFQQLAKLPFMLGNKFCCPCCEWQFNRLLSFYGRDGVRCPYCNSLPRQRFQAWLLSEGLGLNLSEVSILHFAPEFSLSKYLKRKTTRRYTRADALISFIPGVCVRPDIVADIRSLRLAAGSSDLVICNHVLEHVREDACALAELSRVLSDGGLALVTVPISDVSDTTLEDLSIDTPQLRDRHYGSPDHVRLYGMDIVDRFRAAGFDVEIRRPRDWLPAGKIEEWSLDEAEPHFILSKGALPEFPGKGR